MESYLECCHFPSILLFGLKQGTEKKTKIMYIGARSESHIDGMVSRTCVHVPNRGYFKDTQ